MDSDPFAHVRMQIGRHIAEMEASGRRLSALAVHNHMDAIRHIAAINGLAALEALARCTAQRALLPGHRVTLKSCIEHLEEALDCRSDSDCTAMLAALAIRLH